MRVRFAFVVLNLAAIAAAPVAAIAADPAPQVKLARDDPKRVVCRRQEVTGSLVQTVKVCRTNAEWRASSRDAQDEATNMQQRGLVNSCGSSSPGAC